MSEVTYPPGQTDDAQASMTENMREKAQEATGQLQERAQDVKGQARDRMRKQLDSRSTQAGEQATSLAATFRKTGDQLRSDGNDGQARIVDEAAERIERLGSYLRQANGDRMLRDVEEFGRRRPWALALAGGVVGLMSARFLKSSSSRRYHQSRRSVSPLADEAFPGAVGQTQPGTPQHQDL
jgi:hypothetical protein